MESLTLDELDRGLLHALHVDGRAPFRRIAEVLGVSDQTVARRYHRLRADDGVRVVGRTRARMLGEVDWLTRVRCVPDAAGAIAEALARRPETSWVSLLSGGGEIICNTRSPARPDREELLLGKLPKTPQVLSVSAHYLLRTFVGGTSAWSGRTSALSAAQVARLQAGAGDGAGAGPMDGAVDGPAASVPAARPVPAVLDGLDRGLLAALAVDGRTPLAELASRTGGSEATVRRRLAALTRSGLLHFDVDVQPRLLGFEVEAFCWLTVHPGRLTAVAQAVADHPEVGFAAATTGPTNLAAGLVCRDIEAFYDYLTDRLGGLEGVVTLESAPVVRSVKRAGLLIR
ncbi:Lrp/AsnC family transcriptional regulator [Kitasatospora sp. A2-31]|uniref:Lrp/AsnC family transcriptional regulator n=1 Tax=Kitasatospora sp. A2-31 TaxID=2916414 RepID=UPI001EE9EB46|nr:AsnC family transcriptional regulator [Kitasatospora sp. A2-31]MCG6497119.1 Lrp/AsnC family transcriptional regulator [Kitasatospora sp. A2-31]